MEINIIPIINNTLPKPKAIDLNISKKLNNAENPKPNIKDTNIIIGTKNNIPKVIAKGNAIGAAAIASRINPIYLPIDLPLISVSSKSLAFISNNIS